MRTFKSKLYFIFIGVIILAFSIILSVLLEEKNAINTDTGRGIFILTQVIVNSLFLCSIVYLAFSKKDISNHVITFSLTFILQFLPLLIRELVKGDNPRTILSVIIIFVVLIIYFAIVLPMDVLATRMKQAEVELRGKEIAVQDIDDYNDEDGKFVGANHKKGKK